MDVTVGYLADEIARILDGTIEHRRACQGLLGEIPESGPVADTEIDAFLQECSITRQELVERILNSDLDAVVDLPIEDLEQFRADVKQWSFNANWMNADGPFFPLYAPLRFAPQRAAQERYSQLTSEVVQKLRSYSPSIAVLQKLIDQRINLGSV